MNEGAGQFVNDSAPGGVRGVLGTNANPQSNDPTWVTPGPPISASSPSCPAVPPPVTEVAGSPQVNFQGSLGPVTLGFLLRQGMEVRTGAGGVVAATCDDGRRFRLKELASLFLDGPLCPTAPAGSTLAVTAITTRASSI